MTTSLKLVHRKESAESSANQIRRLPPMHALAAFEAAARLQTFARAAEELCVTQSAISHRIRLLEEHFGVKLFVRVHKQVVLTARGRSFLEEVREAMQRLSDAAAIVSAQPATRLRVTASPAIAHLVLIPHLQEYFERAGFVELEIDTSSPVKDLEEDRFDLGLRFGSGNWPGYMTELLVEEQTSAFANPKYVQAFGRQRTLDDLLKANLIHSKAFHWNQWLTSTGSHKTIAPAEGLSFVQVAAAIEAAAHGLGVVLANNATTVVQRRSGSLVKFVDVEVPSNRHYYAVYRSNSPHADTIRDFLDWIKPLVIKTFK